MIYDVSSRTRLNQAVFDLERETSQSARARLECTIIRLKGKITESEGANIVFAYTPQPLTTRVEHAASTALISCLPSVPKSKLFS